MTAKLWLLWLRAHLDVLGKEMLGCDYLESYLASGTTNWNNQALRAVSLPLSHIQHLQQEQLHAMSWFISVFRALMLCKINLHAKATQSPYSWLTLPPAMSPLSSHACDCQQSTHLFAVHGRYDDNWPPSGLGTHTGEILHHPENAFANRGSIFCYLWGMLDIAQVELPAQLRVGGFMMGSNNFRARRRKMQHQDSGKRSLQWGHLVADK